MERSADRDERSETIEEQLVSLLSMQVRRVPLPVFLAACMIAGMAWPSIPSTAIVAWLVLVAGVLGLRWFVLGRLGDRTDIPAHRRLNIAILLSALNGMTHGLSLLFFAGMPQFERAIQSMLLVGMCAGSVATTGGYRPVFIAYIAPTLGPLAVLWAISPGIEHVTWIEPVMALLIVLFALVLEALTRDTYRLIRESFEIRMERAVLNRELRNALDAAEAASRAKTRFLASASHDLRQPMQTLSLFAAALALRPLDERSRTIAQNMNEALQDLTIELDALLDVSKLDAGVVRAEMMDIQLLPLLERIGEVFKPAALDKQLELTLHCPAGVWVRSDRKLLERIVRNLLENAVKYTDAGGVTVSVEVADDQCVLRVADTGPGIPAAEHTRIFEEFYQVDNPERDRRRGLGLGLAIVKRLADLMHVGLSFTSQAGQGTCFALTLPCSASVSVEQTATRPSPPSLCALNILVVDDEEAVRLGMKALLEELGCNVSMAASTSEAVCAVHATDPDVLIADFRLRGSDNGISTIRAVRDLRPKLPALLMSGETSPDRLRAAQDAGISVIHKPVTPDVLKQEIARLALL